MVTFQQFASEVARQISISFLSHRRNRNSAFHLCPVDSDCRLVDSDDVVLVASWVVRVTTTSGQRLEDVCVSLVARDGDRVRIGITVQSPNGVCRSQVVRRIETIGIVQPIFGRIGRDTLRYDWFHRASEFISV